MLTDAQTPFLGTPVLLLTIVVGVVVVVGSSARTSRLYLEGAAAPCSLPTLPGKP